MASFVGRAKDIIAFLTSDNIDQDAIWDLTIHKKKRSLSSNAYYWQLLEKIAVKTHEPKAKLHNLNLRTLGLVQRVEDKPVYTLIPDTVEAENEALNALTYHIAPRSATVEGKDGVRYRYYVLLRGSSSFSVSEMQALVDFAVQDAKALDIEVLTPNELQRMREVELQHEQKHNPR